MIRALFWPVIAGLCFSIWPFIMKASGLNAIMASFILTAVSLLVYTPFLKGSYDQTAFLKIGVLLAMVSGVLNGVGTIAYQKMIGTREMEITQGVLIVIMIQVVITAAGGRLFYGDLFTVKKILGLVAAVIAVYLLTSK